MRENGGAETYRRQFQLWLATRRIRSVFCWRREDWRTGGYGPYIGAVGRRVSRISSMVSSLTLSSLKFVNSREAMLVVFKFLLVPPSLANLTFFYTIKDSWIAPRLPSSLIICLQLFDLSQYICFVSVTVQAVFNRNSHPVGGGCRNPAAKWEGDFLNTFSLL